MTAAVLTLVLLAAPSQAVSRAHFGKAQKAFAQHDWRRALDEFTAAGEAAPAELPDLWFDIGQCHRNLGHARQAVAAFTRYLELRPDAPDRDKVRALVVALGGEPPPDDPPPAAAPSPSSSSSSSSSVDPVVAGVVVVVVVAVARPVAGRGRGRRDERAGRGRPHAVAGGERAAAGAGERRAAARKPHRRWKLWTGVAVGVALVAVGVGLGVGLGTAPSGGGATMPPAIPSLGSAATFDTRGH